MSTLILPAELDRTRPPPPPAAQRAACVVLGVGLVLLGLFVLEGFLRALAWSAILAVATWPLYARLARRFPPGKHNILLPLLFTTASTLVVLVPLVILAYQAGQEARGIATLIRDARQQGVPMPGVLTHLPAFQPQVTAWWQENLARPEGAQAWLGRMDQEVMQFGRSYGGRLMHTAVNFAFTMLALFFLYRDGETVAHQLLGAAERLFGPHGVRVSRQVVASVHGTVDGLVLVGLGVGLVLGIGYAIVGVPHPALLGAVTAGAAMVPVAAWAVLGLACLLAFAAGKTVAAVILAVVGALVLFSADHFVRPVLIGGATKLPFLWVLLGILGGVETMGLIGLFLGPAVMSALILLWREWVCGAKLDAT